MRRLADWELLLYGVAGALITVSVGTPALAWGVVLLVAWAAGQP